MTPEGTSPRGITKGPMQVNGSKSYTFLLAGKFTSASVEDGHHSASLKRMESFKNHRAGWAKQTPKEDEACHVDNPCEL